MALARQLMQVPLDLGLSTKIDSKQNEMGTLAQAENVVYETTKSLRKRNGYDSVNLQTIDNNDLTNLKIISKFKNELIAMNETNLYSYSDSVQKWTDKGSCYSIKTNSTAVFKSASSQFNLDSLYLENLKVFSWQDSAGGVYYSVQDSSNNSFLASGVQVSATGEVPALANIQNFVYIFYKDVGDIKFKKFSILNPSVLSSEVTAKTDIDLVNPKMDVVSCGVKVFVGYNSSVVLSRLSIFSVDQNNNVSSTVSIAGEDANFAINITCDTQSRIILSNSDGTDVKVTIFPFTLSSTLLATTTIETIANCTNLTSVQEADMTYKIYYEISAAASVNYYVKSAKFTGLGVVSAITTVAKSVGLASSAWLRGSLTYVNVIHSSGLQSTYFTMDQNGILLSKINNQNAGSLIFSGVLPNISIIDSNNFLFANNIKTRTTSENGVFFSLEGVNSTIVNFNNEIPFQTEFMADNLHISGGILKMYDGNVVVEHGFNVFPENLAAGATTALGGFMEDGDYAYVAVYKWTDNNGQDHQSSPSLISLDVTLSGGTSTQTQAIVVPTLRLTEKENVVIDIYRTEDAGTIYYKITSNLTPLMNNKTVDTVTFVDTLSDSQLISREALYTTGGILENIAAPETFLIAAYNNRLVVVGENKNELTFSKNLEEGKPIEFTDLIKKKVNPVGGDISAIIQMNDKLIIFESDACFFISGNGPNNAGEQDDFTLPEVISTDIGCIDTNSVILTPSGVMFKSRKGIYQITEGMALEYIGDKVEAFNDSSISSADVVGELNQIRFITTESLALVFNYHLNKWATFTNHGGRSSVVIGNDYYYLREDDTIFKENRTSFSDASIPIRMLLETNWINISVIQGFQRVLKTWLLGTYKSAHKLLVNVAYDYQEAFIQQVNIDTSEFIDSTPYGGYSPYGDPPNKTYGSSGNLYQMRIDPKVQKCESIKFKIEDLQEDAGEGLSISAFTFEVGIKDGGNKLPATNKFGLK